MIARRVGGIELHVPSSHANLLYLHLHSQSHLQPTLAKPKPQNMETASSMEKDCSVSALVASRLAPNDARLILVFRTPKTAL